MFKLLRRYQRHILAVGVTLLMVAFLIQPTLRIFGPNPAKRVVGTIGDRDLTVADRRSARVELMILAAVSPGLERVAADDGLQWLLMLDEAESMGLSASESQVNELLLYLGEGQAKVERAAQEVGVPTARVREALRRWLMVQQYQELVRGLGHIALDQRLAHYNAAGQFFQMGYVQGAVGELLAAQGRPRVSEPVRRRLLYDQYAKAGVVAVRVGDRAVLPDAGDAPEADGAGADDARGDGAGGDAPASDDQPAPTEQELAALFTAYKDSLPGEGEPYGLGYRRPDRVKIEYLVIPFNRVRESIHVDEADALQYYDDHPDQFQVSPTDAAAGVKPYDQVRDQVHETLTKQASAAAAQKMAKAARAILLENARTLAESRAYRVIPEGWTPMSLEDVAAQLQRQFGVLPDVHALGDRWLGRGEVALLPGIGSASLAGRSSTKFADYVFSARELWPDADQPPALATLRLQAMMPSLPLTSFDGAWYLFRLTAAEPASSPASLDDVRAQVERDARRVARYERLKARTERWAKWAGDASVEAVARKLGSPTLRPSPFPRREPMPGGGMGVPQVEGVGRDQAFVDAVFDLAYRVQDAGGIEAVQVKDRTAAVAVDHGLCLYLVRLDRYEPMTEKEYDALAESVGVEVWLHHALVGEGAQNPIDTKIISERVGYVGAEGEQGGDDEGSEPLGG